MQREPSPAAANEQTRAPRAKPNVPPISTAAITRDEGFGTGRDDRTCGGVVSWPVQALLTTHDVM